ncbi:MAG: hypothetical protein SAL70_41075, partial [Scytonema sp. PMC 1070.18]|nr:hypothetical protein [Scytonema sp. PMC 1070.18]
MAQGVYHLVAGMIVLMMWVVIEVVGQLLEQMRVLPELQVLAEMLLVSSVLQGQVQVLQGQVLQVQGQVLQVQVQ